MDNFSVDFLNGDYSTAYFNSPRKKSQKNYCNSFNLELSSGIVHADEINHVIVNILVSVELLKALSHQ